MNRPLRARVPIGRILAVGGPASGPAAVGMRQAGDRGGRVWCDGVCGCWGGGPPGSGSW